MKKLLCALVAIAMLAAMTACNNGGEGGKSTSEGTKNTAATTEPTGTTKEGKTTSTPSTTEPASSVTSTEDPTVSTEPAETEPPRNWDETLPKQLYMTPDLSTTYDDGGYYAKFATFSLTKNDKNGIKVSSTNSEGDRCLWAFVNEVVDARPILHYELEEGSAIYKIEISRAWDIEMPIEIDIDPGAHTINLKEMLEQHTITQGYSYVVIYTSGDANINNFYLGTE